MNQIRIFDESFEAAFKNGVQFLKISTEDDNGSREPLTKWAPSSTSKLICSYCKTEFDDVVQQREHYKLDWHRYNLKQNLRLKPTITEEDFNEKADDVSSISGSDSEKEDSSENIAILRGRLFLKNSEGVVFSLYRCLLFEKKEELCDEILLKGLEKLHRNNQWTLLMLGGGHFAGGVFQGSTIILHKTFHAYVIRSGQGSSQRSMDNRSGSFQAKSAGASLRRYNELALTQHIHDIVRAWKKEIDNSSLIVYRAAGSFNQFVFFGGKAPILDRSDSRLKTIPFVTKRPTFAELKRVHTLLTTVTMYESFDQVSGILKQEATDSSLKRSKKKTTNIDRAKSRENVERPSPINDSSTDDDVRVPNDSDENLEVDLIFSDQEISMTSVLQPFEDSLTVEERRQRKKKSKKDKLKHKRQIKEDLTRKKQLYDFVSSGHVQNLENHLKERGGGHVDTEIHNIGLINEVLDDVGNTLLHVAALHQQLEVIRFLLEKGADPCLRNQKQQTAYSCTQNNNVRKIFKNFAQEFPERHNYTKAQIPVPVELTEEQLNRRNAQRKLKKEKDKEKKKITQLIQQEEMHKGN